MTDEVEEAALALMDRIASGGGAVAAIERGFQKSEIERAAYDVARSIDSGERVVVGVNRFTVDDEEEFVPLRGNPAIEADQRERLAKLRAGRDQAAVGQHLRELQEAARGTANVLYPMKEALRAGATAGEVCNALREVWGTYRPPDTF
jgi:methylmalonyl-CoA mutase N-terminal domain/subunit